MKLNNHKLLVAIIQVININWLILFISTAKVYPGPPGDVEKHPGDAPDSGYIAIVTIVVATLLVLVLTVVS